MAADSAREIRLGRRPYDLIRDMDPGSLKEKLESFASGPFAPTDFSIGHRGAALRFPEHTRESYEAAARQGAGIVECDVTFTADLELVCRHSQCDLHTTTNILAVPELAAKCSEPFTPYDSETGKPASARCCTSDITLKEFLSLRGKADTANPYAATPEEYMGGPTDGQTLAWGTLLSHRESIALFQNLGVNMIPELKSPEVPIPFMGRYTQQAYARQMIADYTAVGVAPERVFAQSFNLDDILYWIDTAPEFGRQAMLLDGRYEDPAFDHRDPATWRPGMEELAALGVNILAPPMWMLLRLDAKQRIRPSVYAERARGAGLSVIAWTLERSGSLKEGGGWYYQTVTDAIHKDGDMYRVLDVLARDVGIIGMFSDWPATVTYYANCFGLGLKRQVPGGKGTGGS